MNEPLFSKGDLVYVKGTSEEYKKEHPIIINYIKKDSWKSKDDDGIISEIEYWAYSSNGSGWYPESTITNKIKEY